MVRVLALVVRDMRVVTVLRFGKNTGGDSIRGFSGITVVFGEFVRDCAENGFLCLRRVSESRFGIQSCRLVANRVRENDLGMPRFRAIFSLATCVRRCELKYLILFRMPLFRKSCDLSTMPLG